MAKKSKQFELPGRGDRLNARNMDRWLTDAMDANDHKSQRGPLGFREPAFVIDVVNVDDEAIQARHPVALDSSAEKTFPLFLDRRSCEVRNLANGINGPLVSGIALNYIAAGHTGKAYVSGVCAAKMTDTQRAYFLMSGAQIIWQEDDLDVQSERWSVVRLGGTPRPLTVQIIGGNLQNGVATIKYVASTVTLALTRTYDPTVDTVYIDGLGYGDLSSAGSLTTTRVLVRNDYDAFADSLMGGDAWLVQGFDTLDYLGETMSVVKIRRG